MKTTTAPVIRLKNYTPPPYTINSVHLDVILNDSDTVVTSTITVERAKNTATNEPLVLDGDELTLDVVWLDGEELSEGAYTATPQMLTLSDLPSAPSFELTIQTRLAPSQNTKLMGLYQSSGVFCTQCEAEGFRRITYFLDRPDVLAIYTVRLEADKDACPVLLSNGNPVKVGDLDGGRHFAIWHDPHPKPSYLFAMVGGNLDVLSDTFTTMNGRSVDLNIYVETGKAQLATYAMDALKRSMIWDEQNYGCEYDLDVFNIVAVSDFNMGAMENKGLNVFNDKYVLADPDVATDNDFRNIEAIIAHEYFHNWTGNRITCRDWFQLCLKEGLTVYRDQEFSADQRSRAVERILQVRGLKAAQFPEDAGPLAHPVRPGAYKEINNFYTATVYQKGAELVRMIATLVGPQDFRAGTDLYFERHDGEAAVVEDFLACFEEVSGQDFTQFARWYAQAGTPVVEVEENWEPARNRYSLTLTQSTPPTPGQNAKKVVPIPIRFGLIGQDGEELHARTQSTSVEGDVILLTRQQTTVTFDDIEEKPTPSLLRGFSAPVQLRYAEPAQSKLFRAEHDNDLYNRWEALDGFALQLLADMPTNGSVFDADERKGFVNAVVKTAFDATIDPLLRANVLSLPTQMTIAREIGKNVDPESVHKARSELITSLAKAFGAQGIELLSSLKGDRSQDELQAAANRALKLAILPILMAGKITGADEFAVQQYEEASNMTDRLGALGAIAHFAQDEVLKEKYLKNFYDRYADNDLVLHTWFSLQATISGKEGLKRFAELLEHPKFTLNNPNRARSLLGPFAANNPTAFYGQDAKGMALFASEIEKLDSINPQIAARLLTLISSFRIFGDDISETVDLRLQKIAAKDSLSVDVLEIVESLIS